MAIVRRAKRETPFVQMDKTPLQDKSLSWKAKGVLAYLLSLPDDWEVYLSEITNHAKDGKDSTRSAFDELMKAGYVTREKARKVKGKFSGYNYTVSDYPQRFNRNGKPDVGKSATTNNDNTNNEVTNNIEEAAKATSAPTVISNEDVKDFEEQVKDRKTKKRFAKPTLEEIKDYFQKKFREKKVSNPEELATQEADRFYNYYESNGWKVGRNKMTSWPHAVGGWIGRMPDYKLSGRVVSINSPKQNKNAIDAICSEETANELQAAFIAGGCNW